MKIVLPVVFTARLAESLAELLTVPPKVMSEPPFELNVTVRTPALPRSTTLSL